jgi:hypothetical protein
MSTDWISGGRAPRERADPASRVPLRSPSDGRADGRAFTRRAPLRSAPPTLKPSGAKDLWVPLGPSDTVRGQADRHPRIAGRVRSIAVSDDGVRVYAGTAQGGVWYSADAGRSWLPLDFYASTPDLSGELGESNALSVGSVAVQFDVADEEALDVVFVGTGEQRHTGFTPLPREVQGVGVRVAMGPAALVRAEGPTAEPWDLEAKNIAGAAVLRMAFDRRDSRIVWAATTRGLFRRPPSTLGFGGEWDPVDLPFVGDPPITDVVVTRGRGDEPQRIYVGSEGDLVAWSVTGDPGTWQVVLLPPHPEHSGESLEPIARTALAEGNPHGEVLVWVLGGGPRLWRIGGADVAEVVTGLPPEIFAEQSVYDMAIAVDPAADHPLRIVVGGSAVESEAPSGEYNAALYAGDVTPAAPGRWEFPGGGDNPLPSSWIGGGVHADVHAIAWVPGPAGGEAQIWVACDGGVFCSDQQVPLGVFGSRNHGIANLETQYLAQHPTSDAVLLAGTQDNGVIRRLSEETWTVAHPGDGGGLAIDPIDPRRVIAQYINSDWMISTDGGVTLRDLTFMRAAPSTATQKLSDAYAKAHAEEHAAAAFTSNAAVVVRKDAAGKDVTRLAIGTDRVWLSENWGASWVTLPSAKDPYDPSRPGAPDRTTDVLGMSQSVYVLRWATPTRLHGLTDEYIVLLEQAGTSWSQRRLHDRIKVDLDTKDAVPPGRIPAYLAVTDLASHLPERGPLGSLYAATSGVGDQHVWWFDGTDTWHSATLDVDSPVHALVVDPADRHVVYAGTDVGVYRGVGTFPPADGPELKWVWEHVANGLPEASCVDLEIHAPTRLLRAALRGRGLWEMALDGFEQPHEAYVRAHPYNTRRRPVPTGEKDPLGDPKAPVILRLDASPDLRVFRAPGSPPPAPGALPLGTDEFDTWVAQAAIRARGGLIEADGQWNAATIAALGGAVPATLSQWNALVGPHANEPPFDYDPPDAADVAANLRDEPDRRGGQRASCATGDGLVRVFVTVHGRDWRAFDPDDVAVFLLRTPFSGKTDLSGHPSIPNPAGGWAEELDRELLAPSPGAWLQGSAWSYADPARPFRRSTGGVDGRQAQVVTFDVTLSPWPAEDRGWLLLAVVIAEGDLLVKAETDVAALVRARHQVAARSVRGATAPPAHAAPDSESR